MRRTVALAALALSLAAAGATSAAAPGGAAGAGVGTGVTRGIVGYGTVHAEGSGSPPDCTSPRSTSGSAEYDCSAFAADSYAACTGDGESSSCAITLRAQLPDPGGWRFDHWSGSCSGTSAICTLITSETSCDPELKPPCHTDALGPFTVVAHFADTRAPTTSFSQAPAADSVLFAEATTQTFTWSTDEEGEAPTFACSRDGGAFAACSSGLTWSSISDGVHELCVRAADASGLQGAAACRRWEQEQNPTVAIRTHPAAVTTDSEASFSYDTNKSTHPADGSTLGFLCSLDGAAFAACPASGETYGGLAAGQHVFEVEAVFHGALEATAVSHPSPPAIYAWTQAAAAPPGTPPSAGPAPDDPAATPTGAAPAPPAAAPSPSSPSRLICKRGYRKRKVKGRLRCVKVRHHRR